MTIMTTASGLRFDLARPSPMYVVIEDIAHHLAQINRFGGAAARPYSVAEHSVLALRIAERELGMIDPHGLMAVLLHDAHEAYFGDVTQPMKQVLAMGGTFAASAEEAVERAVRARFRLQVAAVAYRNDIRRADLIALATERRHLLPAHTHGERWEVLDGIQPIDWAAIDSAAITPWTFWRDRFLDNYRSLRAGIETLALRTATPGAAHAG